MTGLIAAVATVAMAATPLMAGVRVSSPAWIVPDALPPGVTVQAANNNVSLARHEGRLYVAFRTAPTHFASSRAELVVLTSTDSGTSWTHEFTLSPGRDVREPVLVPFQGKLFLYYVELGRRAWAFEPGLARLTERVGPGRWTLPEAVGAPGEMVWEVKERGGRLWMSGYRGGHYKLFGKSAVELLFRVSEDGRKWKDAPGAAGPVYRGGVSEAAFEWDEAGLLWVVGRNEDGDASGFGTRVGFAPKDTPGSWNFPAPSLPERTDSPRLFLQHGELLLLARRDVGGPFDRAPACLPFTLRRLWNLIAYWFRPKRTSMYRLDRAKGTLEVLADLPSAGDTAFPALVRTGPKSVLVANYTSPPETAASWSWLRGQLQPTGIYLTTLTFTD